MDALLSIQDQILGLRWRHFVTRGFFGDLSLGCVQGVMVSIHLVMAVGGDPHRIRVEAIAIMDVFLIATALLIFSLGLCELFIAKLDLPKWLAIRNLDDLKDKLRGVIIFVMTMTFLEHLVLWQDAVATLKFGCAIAVVVVALVVSARFGRAEDDSGNRHE